MTEPTVTVERDDHVLLIGVNRPAKRNAWNLAVIDEVAAAYEVLGTDPDLRVGVVFGHGDHFSAGLDLAEVAPVVAEQGPAALSGSHAFDPFALWGPPVPKPVVLALNGIAYTLSIELALAADIVVCADDARLRQLEIGRGIMPFGGATVRAVTSLGWGNAMRFLLTAEEFGAADANATYDPTHPSGASAVARSFIAGVVRHMPAMCGLVAPSPVSYMRLGPHHWSCGYAAFGIQNREASIRICPSTSKDPATAARGFNLELRPPDPTASPYMVLGALVRAGLEGIRAGLELPPACDVDPSDLTDEQRAEMGILPLPSSLPEALDLMLADDVVMSWMSPVMAESYVAVKRMEQELTEGETDEQTAERYRNAY